MIDVQRIKKAAEDRMQRIKKEAEFWAYKEATDRIKREKNRVRMAKWRADNPGKTNERQRATYARMVEYFDTNFPSPPKKRKKQKI